MPITVASLKGKIKDKLDAEFGAPTDPAWQEKFCKAIAEAIVEEIQASALVTGTVTSGAGSGGAVTGTVS